METKIYYRIVWPEPTMAYDHALTLEAARQKVADLAKGIKNPGHRAYWKNIAKGARIFRVIELAEEVQPNNSIHLQP